MTNQNKTLEQKRAIFFQIGMLVSLAFVLFAFEWTSADYTKISNNEHITEGMDLDVIPILPRKKQKKKKQEVNTSITLLTIVKSLVEPDPDPDPVIDPDIEPDIYDPEILDIEIGDDGGDLEDDPNVLINASVVEIQPYFEDCYNVLDRDQQSNCSFGKIINHIQSNLRIPNIIQDIGLSGKTYVSFIVNRKGEIEKVEVLKGIHPSMDKEAIRVVESLPKMIPASQQGRTVSVQYQIPIKVNLQ